MTGATWGFVGLGEMGDPMAASLLAAGIPLVAFDRDPGRIATAQARGAQGAGSVAEVAGSADVVSICVRDEHQLDAVVAEGFGAAGAAGTTVLVHSTVGPSCCRRVAAELARARVAVVDAPISGMRMAAAAGTLTFFVGGEPDAVQRARPGLEAMGETIVHVGDVGSGQVVKLANNLVAFGTLAFVREAVALGRATGTDAATLLAALRRGTARSWVAEHWDFLTEGWAASQPGGAEAIGDIVHKDLDGAAKAAAEAGVQAPFAELAARLVPPALVEQLRHEGERP
jgi:3-hydroxyisobutyrate dehydrogenase-like beta-hydroxyacid dehydrogenase